jgi:hypothetical protein
MKAISLSILLTLAILIGPGKSFSQATDSTTSFTFGNALQFQLIGGVGLDYIAGLSLSSCFRIGADLSLNHTDRSGSQSSSEIYSYPPSSPSTDTISTSPDQTSNTYAITLSGLYIQKLAQYRNTILYFGAGPEVAYSWGRSSDNEPGRRTSQGTIETQETSTESTNKTTGIGPVAILGVGSRIVDQVSVTAEIGLSALYEWSSTSSATSYSYTQPSYQYSDTFNSSSHTTGWTISLANVRIGILVGL